MEFPKSFMEFHNCMIFMEFHKSFMEFHKSFMECYKYAHLWNAINHVEEEAKYMVNFLSQMSGVVKERK